MPIREEFGGATYFMLETHYDNPAIQQDLVDTSGIRIFLTDRLRQHDTGMILVGTEVNFLHMIPPFQDNFQTLGRCTSECTMKVSFPLALICNGRVRLRAVHILHNPFPTQKPNLLPPLLFSDLVITMYCKCNHLAYLLPLK